MPKFDGGEQGRAIQGQARRRLLLEEAGLGRKAELDEETEFNTTPACASVWIYMRM